MLGKLHYPSKFFKYWIDQEHIKKLANYVGEEGKRRGEKRGKGDRRKRWEKWEKYWIKLEEKNRENKERKKRWRNYSYLVREMVKKIKWEVNGKILNHAMWGIMLNNINEVLASHIKSNQEGAG